MRNLLWSLLALGVAAACPLLTGCAGDARPATTVYVPEVKPIAVSCVPQQLPPVPDGLLTKEALAAIPEGPDRYVAIAADWAVRTARMLQTEPIIKNCRKTTP